MEIEEAEDEDMEDDEKIAPNRGSFGFGHDSDSHSPQTHVVIQSYRREPTPDSLSVK